MRLELRSAFVSTLIFVLVSALISYGCSSSDDGEPQVPTGPEVLELEVSKDLRTSLAAHSTAVLADSIDAYIGRINPVALPTLEADLRALLESEAGSYELVRAEIDEAALGRRPFALEPEDLRFYVIDDGGTNARIAPLRPATEPSEGDADLKAAVGELIDAIEATGLDVGQLRNAWASTRFHDEANFPGGLPEGTNDGATFLWDNSVFWNGAWHNGGILFWSDGFNHMVLASRHVTALKDREFVGAEFNLGSGSETVLHEFGHIIMSRTGCAEDDDDDLMAAVLERVMSRRVEMELGRVGTGAPLRGDVESYSNNVAELVERGGVNCLRDLTWGLPAETLTIEAPATVQTGESFDAEIFIRRIGGDPASNEWVWTWVETQIVVIQLNPTGIGTRTITAPNKPGQIRIRAKALGKEAEITVQVVGDPVGACCVLGECSIRSAAGCTERDGTWLGSGQACEPNPCPQPGACCVQGECFVVADSAACVSGDGEWQGAGVPCGTETCPAPSGACCLEDGSCVVTVQANCDGTYAGDDTSCEPNPCPQPGACCIGTDCGILLSAQCDGEFLGEGTACDPDPCFIPGACCGSDGSCQVGTEPDCDGNFQGEGTSCDPNVCPRPGACCDPDGSCSVTLEDTCTQNFLGEDTVCEPNPCPQPPEGACCWGKSNEQCTVRSESRCTRELGGTYLGDGTTCFSSPCTDPLAGACCLSSGRCEFLRESSCIGEFFGIGTPCSPGLCDQPAAGACCLAEGACQVLSPSNCAGADGQYQGDGTSCDPNPCPQPGSGACCFSSGLCDVETPSACSTNGGQFQGDGTVCDPNPCPQPASGACCLTAGACQVLSPTDCTNADGQYQGDGTVCDPNPCPQPGSGACCFSSGFCDVETPSACSTNGGQYQGDGTVCDPNPCPQPAAGACCLSAGACQVLSPTDCTNADGQYQGDGTVCDPNPCPQPAAGACCLSAGACQVLSPTDCTNADGQYQGDGTVCDPNPCPQPGNGACCFESGFCDVETASACSTNGGQYQGDGTVCDPNPCPQPPAGACCLAEGACQVLSPSDCTSADGQYEGDGTDCDPNPCPQPGTGACCFASGFCDVETASACSTNGGDYLGDGEACDPNPCPQQAKASIQFLESGVAHSRGSSDICLRIHVEGPDVAGALLTIEVSGPSSSGGEELVVGGDGLVSLDRQIFQFGNYAWAVTQLQSREQTYELQGDVKGVIEVGAEERPCQR